MDLNHRPTTYKDAALTGLSYAPISPAMQQLLRISAIQSTATQCRVVGFKMYERGGFKPPMPRTNSWIEPGEAASFANKRKPMGSKFWNPLIIVFGYHPQRWRVYRFPLPLKLVVGGGFGPPMFTCVGM